MLPPPPLAWVPLFTQSIQGAIGTTAEADVRQTVNPLLYQIKIRFGEKQPGKDLMIIWNLFQMFAHKNDAIPQGRVESDAGDSITMLVVVRRRLGLPRVDHPLG